MNATEMGRRSDSLYYDNVSRRELCDRIAHLESDLEDAKDKNAKLWELVVLWSVINKHMSLCATTDCGQCPVREECGESVYLEGLLGIDSKGLSWRVQERMAETTDVQAENAMLREQVAEACMQLGGAWVRCTELRELLCDLWRFTKAACEKYPKLFDPAAQGGQMVQLNAIDAFEQRMRELGVELD